MIVIGTEKNSLLLTSMLLWTNVVFHSSDKACLNLLSLLNETRTCPIPTFQAGAFSFPTFPLQ